MRKGLIYTLKYCAVAFMNNCNNAKKTRFNVVSWIASRLYKYRSWWFTSRRGDLCHNRQLEKGAGGSCEDHCPRGVVWWASLLAHNGLQDTSGWLDCSPQMPAIWKDVWKTVTEERWHMNFEQQEEITRMCNRSSTMRLIVEHFLNV